MGTDAEHAAFRDDKPIDPLGGRIHEHFETVPMVLPSLAATDTPSICETSSDASGFFIGAVLALPPGELPPTPGAAECEDDVPSRGDGIVD
ncbi:MAG TPA: hypothetical protein VKV32_08255 [Stellaceae bacterium]|nr:hypothetical protein [Stellaceae bacterium]